MTKEQRQELLTAYRYAYQYAEDNIEDTVINMLVDDYPEYSRSEIEEVVDNYA